VWIPGRDGADCLKESRRKENPEIAGAAQAIVNWTDVSVLASCQK
jgi:hypothetical protein